MERGLMTTTSQTKCDDTTNGSIQNTSGKPKGRKFTLLDLHRLTWQADEQGTLTVETATREQSNAFASEVADVEDVDINVWPLEGRRDFVNNIYDFCLTEGFDFPVPVVADEA